MDAETESTVKAFEGVLDDLTFNSRPIITTLTRMAEENISCAQYFVDLIEARIEKCKPSQKLYAFYVMDSICKNAGSPYTIYFSRNLATLYRKTYLLVDNTTRTKLIRMFKTWIEPNQSTGGATFLFEKTALDRIEQFLIKASALHQKNLESQLPKPTVPLLLKEIDKLTYITNERLKDQPGDDKLQKKELVLQQLKKELQREKLAPNALKQVQMQLRNIFAQDYQKLQDKLRVQQQRQQQEQLSQQQQQQQQIQQPSGLEQNSLPGDSFVSEKSSIPLFGDNVGSSLFGDSSPMFATPDFVENEAQAQVNSKSSKMKSLFEELESLGLLYRPPKESIVTLYSKLSGETGDSDVDLKFKENAQLKKVPPPSILQGIILDCKAHFATSKVDILNTPSLQLTQGNLLNDNPIVDNRLIHLLYRSKPNKCLTCGRRFGNSMEDKRAEAEHLDWHFRINSRMKGTRANNNPFTSNGGTTTQKNIQSRIWFLEDNAWAKFNDDEIVSPNMNVEPTKFTKDYKTNTGRGQHNNAEAQSTGSNIDDEIDMNTLLKKSVVVPETSEDMSFQCPVCKETVGSVFDEDSGEWVWKNTIRVDDKYLHATCYYEAAKSRDNTSGISVDLNNLKQILE
ncbi:Protein PCF11 [Nakaseomyces bracarensis]|uniref:Protein PCF11 n=1 Tax=Nakaseomyces bracarensis TaxID=273131 RepID=A0ABR4NU72_9SACH